LRFYQDRGDICFLAFARKTTIHEKRPSAEAEVAGMARYCKAIGDNLGNLPDFSLQKTKGLNSESEVELLTVVETGECSQIQPIHTVQIAEYDFKFRTGLTLLQVPINHCICILSYIYPPNSMQCV
jgi:hypothetical protein